MPDRVVVVVDGDVLFHGLLPCRFVAEMVPGREMSDYRRFEQAFLRGPFDAARRGDADTLTLLRSHG